MWQRVAFAALSAPRMSRAPARPACAALLAALAVGTGPLPAAVPHVPPPPVASRPAYVPRPPVAVDRDFARALRLAPRQTPYTMHVDTSVLPTPPSPASLREARQRLESRLCLRLLGALVAGMVIGFERRSANSMAGVRICTLVSLGAAMLFSIALTMPVGQNLARALASACTSVGFLGANVLSCRPTYRKGLTSAAGVWLAAACGVSSASGMTLLAVFGAVSTALISRYLRMTNSLQLLRPSEPDPVADSEDLVVKED